ncbi:hypothetical protein BH09PSE2_BH09PSE2_09350 [soil metagenome]
MLDRIAFVGDDHPDLAVQDLDARLGDGERMVMEDGGAALRIALPRRMKLRGGKVWASYGQAQPEAGRADPALVELLQRVHLSQPVWAGGDALHRAYLRRLTSLSPAVQKRILTGDLPEEVTLKALLGADPPLRWSQQERWMETLCG